MQHLRIPSVLIVAVAFAAAVPGSAAQGQRVQVNPITPPKVPLPNEAASMGITKFSFIAYGDTRGRHDSVQVQSEHQLVIDQMLATIRSRASGSGAIRFVLQSGDAVLSGKVAAQWNNAYIPLINRLTTDAGVPYFLAVGNHDVSGAIGSAQRDSGLRNYFAANARLIPPEGAPRRLNGYPAFAFGFGNSFFLAFDSNIPGDSVQFEWARRQLEGLDRKRYRNIVVFFHHPAFTSGPHGAARIEPQTAVVRERWMPLFRTHHVKLLLTGHDHLFDHWVERYADSTGMYRMDQVVTGGGGAPLYAYAGEPDLSAYIRANAASQVSVQHLARPSVDPGGNPFHFVVVNVDGERISLEVVAVDWGRGFAPYRSAGAVLSDTGQVRPD